MIKIYTDGSCLENPGNGGWAAIIIDNGKKTQIKGSKKNTTNNQMELLAPIQALKKIPRGSKIEIFTDSKYVKSGITEWIHNWKKNGWKTAFLINTSRGPIVNEDDLIIALSTNVIAGAGIDVYEKEPLPSDHKLRFIPNALLLPHIGYVTAENYSIFYTQMFENLESCVSGKPIRVIK